MTIARADPSGGDATMSNVGLHACVHVVITD